VLRLLFLLAVITAVRAQTGENVLLVVNKNDPASCRIADYYRIRRSVPLKNVCYLSSPLDEEISWQVYQDRVEQPIGNCLKGAGLREKVLYIVTTMGVPLKVDGAGSESAADPVSVGSESAVE